MELASLVTVLLLALALAAQPWSVLAAVLLVTAADGRTKAIAYACGWALALAVVAVLVVALSPHAGPPSTRSVVVSWLEIAGGVALGVFAFRRRHRPATPATTRQPRWTRRLDSMSSISAFALGAFLPNYVLVIAAVGELLSDGLRGGRLALAAFAFVLVSSAGVVAPLLVAVVRREDAPRIYADWRAWLTSHAPQLVVGVLGLVALMLIAKGVVGVLAS